MGWEEITGARFHALVHRMSDCSALGFYLGHQEFTFYTHLKSRCSMEMPQFTDICILMAFSFGVSSTFRDSPTGGRCTAGSSEVRQEKVPKTHPGGDPSAGDSGTQNALEFHISDFGDSSQLFIILCNPRALTPIDGELI